MEITIQYGDGRNFDTYRSGPITEQMARSLLYKLFGEGLPASSAGAADRAGCVAENLRTALRHWSGA